MKKLFMTAITITSSLIANTERIPATHPDIVYEGRIHRTNEGEVVQGFPGIKTSFKFNGSDAKINLFASTEPLYIDTIVDAGDPKRIALSKGENRISLFNGDKDIHQVSLYRRNESWQGILTLQSIDITNGKLLPSPEAKGDPLKFLFIGDSITCGEGTDILPLEAANGPHTANGRLSYGRVLADTFNAQCHLVSYGGRGILRDWQGIQKTNNAPEFYERSLPDDETSRWNPKDYVPDAVFVCLGTNDFSSGIPDENDFVTRYVDLIWRIQRDAPKATLFLLNSPMMGFSNRDGVKRQVLDLYLNEVIQRSNHPDIHFISLGHYPGRPENAHPVAHEHVSMAKELEQQVRVRLKW